MQTIYIFRIYSIMLQLLYVGGMGEKNKTKKMIYRLEYGKYNVSGMSAAGLRCLIDEKCSHERVF